VFPSALSPRRTLALRAGLAPALLVAVAATQLLLAHTRGLSAWKGGGFGMFSTVDSPLGRFYRVSLLTDSGEVRVAVPAELEPLAAAARTLPTPERLRRLGAVMAAGRWVPLSMVRAEQRYMELHADRPADDLADPARPRAALPGDLPPGPGPLTFGVLRMQAPGEAPSPQAVAVRGVRVELWRTRFHPPSRTLRGSPVTSVTVPSPRR
jgi:hypothetical protein